MKISIDFDGTMTADPGLWFTVLPHIVAHGHELITVTHRRDTLENRQTIEQHQRDMLGRTWPIVFAYDKPKKFAAIEAGHEVAVWIDDNPHGIGDGSENVSCQSVFEIELRHALKWLNESSTMGSWPFVRELVKRIETVLGPA